MARTEIYKTHLIEPKKNLIAERISNRKTIISCAGLLGISRELYSKKEKGEKPFYDYEMITLAEHFEKPIGYLFFNQQ